MAAPVALTGTGNVTTATITTGATVTVSKPANVADGDLLGALIYIRNSTVTPTVPAGWTLSPAVVATHAGFAFAVKPIPSAAAETATTYAFVGNSSGRGGAAVFRILGAALDAPLGQVGPSNDTAIGTAPQILTLGEVDTIAADHLLLACVAGNISGGTPLGVTPDLAMSEVFELGVSSTSSSTLEVAQEPRPLAGPTGDRDVTFSPAGSSHAGFMLSIAPALPAAGGDIEGWVAESTATTLTQNTTTPITGDGSLRATRTFGSGTEQLRVNDNGQAPGNLTAGGDTLAAEVRVTASGGTGWQGRLEVMTGGVWQTGPWTSITPGATIYQLTYTPAAGVLAAVQKIGVTVEAAGLSGLATVDIDSVEQGTISGANGAGVWQAADQAAYAAVVAAGFNGPAREYHAAGYAWSDADNYTTTNGAPWITAQSGLAVRYGARLFYDDDATGAYANTYATETSNATGQGYADVAARATARLADFTAWLSANGQKGVVSTGWPDTDTNWNTAGAAVLLAATSANVDVHYWTVGEKLGTGNQLSAWEWTGTAWSANPQATVLTVYIVATVVIPPPTNTLPTMQVLMAIGGKALTDPQAAGIFELNASVLDGPDVLGTVAWVDIAADVRSITITSGSGGQFDAAEPTTFTVVVDNTSGNYDPINTAGPYALDVAQQVWIRAEHDAGTDGLVYGYVDDIIPDYGWEPTVTFNCSDGLAMLGRAQVGEILPAFAGDTSGQRINRILDLAQWPTTQRSIATGLVTVQEDTYGDWALPLIQRIVATELGSLFINPDGVLVFFNRLQTYTGARSTTVQATFTDTGDDIDMEQLPASLARGQTFNEARVTRDGGVEQVASDAGSIATYGLQSFSGSVGTMAANDADALSTASWIVARYKTPTLRFPQIEVDATAQDLWPTLLGLRRYDRIRVIRDYGPVQIDRQLIIEGIGHSITAGGSWGMTFDVRDADAFTPFVLGTSKLNSADQLI